MVLGHRKGVQWVGVIPLRQDRLRRRISFLEEQRSQRQDALIAPEMAPELYWRRLGEYFLERRDWDRLDLAFLREASAETILQQWPRLGMAVRERGRVRQRRIQLQRPWAEIEAGVSLELRANLRRRLKRLRTQGELKLCVYQQPAELQPALRECFELEAQGWKGATGTAILSHGAQRRFFRQMAYRLAAAEQFRLYGLRLEGKLIAFEYCAAGGRRLHSLKIAYDEHLRALSPGQVLRLMLLEAAQSEFDDYEFMGDDANWKADWTDEVHELVHLRVYNRTWGGWARLWRARGYAAWRSARQRWRPARRLQPVGGAVTLRGGMES